MLRSEATSQSSKGESRTLRSFSEVGLSASKNSADTSQLAARSFIVLNLCFCLIRMMFYTRDCFPDEERLDIEYPFLRRVRIV